MIYKTAYKNSVVKIFEVDGDPPIIATVTKTNLGGVNVTVEINFDDLGVQEAAELTVDTLFGEGESKKMGKIQPVNYT